MARRNSLAEDLILCPWWVSALLAALTFFVLPRVLPPPLRPLIGIATWVLGALTVLSALRSWKVRWLLDGQTDLESLRALPWKRFEDLIGEAFRRQGYRVSETLGGGADGGVDLVLQRDGAVTLVQCKRWKGKPVPVQTVRELYGVLHDRHASAAKLVATTCFTQEARAFARGKPIELVDQELLLKLIREVQRSGKLVAAEHESAGSSAPACPRCGGMMKMRTARRGANAGGQFWGCAGFPKCRGVRAV